MQVRSEFQRDFVFFASFLFSYLLCAPIVYLISICVLQMCRMVQCGDFLNMKCEMKEEKLRTGRVLRITIYKYSDDFNIEKNYESRPFAE